MTVPTTTAPTATALPVQAAASGTPAGPAQNADFSALLAALTGGAGPQQPAITTGPPVSPEQSPAAQLGRPTEQGRQPLPVLPLQPVDAADPTDAADPAADPADPAPHPGKHTGTDDTPAPLPGQDAAIPLPSPAQDAAAAAAAPALVGALQTRLAPPPPPVHTEAGSVSPAAAPVDAAAAPSSTPRSGTALSTTALSTTAPDPATTAAPAPQAGQPATAHPAHPSAAARHGVPAPSAAPVGRSGAAPHAHTPPADAAPQVDTTQPQAQQTQQQPPVGGVAPSAAPAAPAPVAAPDRTAAPAVVHPQPQLTDAIAHLRARGNGAHQLDVALHPAELGAVHVRAALHGDNLTITVSCADDAARQAVTAALPDLHSALGGLGGTATIDLDLRDTGRGPKQSGDTTPAGRDQRDPSDPNPDDRPRRRSPQSADGVDGLDRWM